ncbi:MAG TPA: SAF domain-containing protein [Nocardioidaceae bacterium]|nr:SAF domain-containing protein [Nocardioidaceae bacterium]
MSRTRLHAIRRDLRRALYARRRLLAGIFAALAVVAAIQAVRPAPPPTRVVLTAATDLRAGQVLSPEDVVLVETAPELIPDGALDPSEPPFGRTLAGPVRAGEPLTDVRLVQGELLAGFEPGTVLATVRVFDPAAVVHLEPGDQVDVVGSDPRGSSTASVIAPDATVVIPPADDDAVTLGEGAPVVVAVDEATALALADAAVRQQLTVLLHE